jgi:hypothetical protein
MQETPNRAAFSQCREEITRAAVLQLDLHGFLLSLLFSSLFLSI